jgi:hypothetical protein
VQQAKAQPDGPRYALNERYRDETASRILTTYCCDIVETSNGKSSREPRERELETPGEGEQNHLYFAGKCCCAILTLLAPLWTRLLPNPANRKEPD